MDNPNKRDYPNDNPVYSLELREGLKNRLIFTDEMLIMNECLSSSKNWRAGNVKTAYNYLLLDPGIIKSLQERFKNISKLEALKVFVSAIFYIGKGNNSRPLDHLHEALPIWNSYQKKAIPKEVYLDKVRQTKILCFMFYVPIASRLI